MKSLILFLLTLISTCSFAEELYSKSFGNRENPALIFLHGGPGYNCASFEGTTAEKLAENGFFVIVYDRRGEGRSPDSKAQFTFKQSFKDLKSLYKKYEIEKATLIGHSFGGILGTKFAKSYPEMANAVVLVGAPVSLQESFVTIIESSRKIYRDKEDYANLNYIDMLEKMDTQSLEYAVYCFAHAMQNGFYSPDSLSDEATAIYENFKSNSTLSGYGSEMTQEGTQGFWENEAYTTIDLSEDLKSLVKAGIPIYGLYGQEDGLYNPSQIEALTKIIGDQNMKYLENCSHSVFMDQQAAFINALKSWIKEG